MKEIARKVLDILPSSLSLFLFRVALYLKEGRQISKNHRKLKEIADNYQNGSDKGFQKNLYDFCIYYSHIGADLYLDSYFNGEPLDIINLNMPDRDNIAEEDVIMICCVKNDVERIKKVVEHHRSIGIRKMVFVDNDSDDGTKEYLREESVDLYSTNEQYHAGRKGAWIRKIQDIYGYNRWYLVVDSDELFSYVGMESHPIQDLVRYAEKKGIERVRSMLLDMYPNHTLYQKEDKNGAEEVDGPYDFINDYRFFDTTTYYDAKDGRGYMVRGGPRRRVFGKHLDHSEPLTKYPLFLCQKEDIWGDHRPIPHHKNFTSLFLSVLRHYKFMAGDIEKYKKIADEGMYYNGSANYKVYLASGENVTFFYEGSKEFTSSVALDSLKILDKIDWSELECE